MPSRRKLLAGLGTAGLLGTAGCLGFSESTFSAGSDADTDWPSTRFDAENSAYNPDAKAPRDGVTETWSQGSGQFNGLPVVAGGTVFQSRRTTFVAIDAASGEQNWGFTPGEQTFRTAPTVRGGLVYVGADETLYALDAGNGSEQWRVENAVGHAPPMLPREGLVHDPPLVVGNEDGVVRGLDPKSGEERWQTEVFGSVSALAWGRRGPYVGTWGGEVYAHYAHDTEPTGVWRTKVDGPVESLTPTSNGLYVQSFGGAFTALAEDRAGVHIRTVESKHANTAPVHASSWLYSGGYDTLSSIREWDGNVHWRVDGEYDSAAPVAAGDRLYVAGKDGVAAFDLDGGIGGGSASFDVKRWSHDLPGAVTGMAVADGALFVSVGQIEDGGKALYRLDEA